jgi:hypothetical protein
MSTHRRTVLVVLGGGALAGLGVLARWVAGAAVPQREQPRPGRVSLADAEKTLRDFRFKEQPGLNPAVQFPLRELTTDEVWDRLGFQMFQVTEGIDQPQTYLVRGTVVKRLGTAFGGQGLMSFLVRPPALVCTYSWGSGTHRSHLAVVNAATLDLTDSGSVFFHGDWFVKPGDGAAVLLEAGKFGDAVNRWSDPTPLGRVAVVREPAGPRPQVEWRGDVPKNLKEQILPFPPQPKQK